MITYVLIAILVVLIFLCLPGSGEMGALNRGVNRFVEGTRGNKDKRE